MFIPLGEGSFSCFHAVPLVLQTHSVRLDGEFHRVSQFNGLALRLLRDGKRLGNRDGNGVGLHGIAESVGHDAIELYAVPCDIGRACLGLAGMSAPFTEGSLDFFHEIPLVLNRASCRLQRNSKRIAELYSLADRLCDDHERLRNRYRGRVGKGGIPFGIRNLTAHLHSVPREIGQSCGESGIVSFPQSPTGRVVFFIIPLVAKVPSVSRYRERYGIAVLCLNILRM